MKREEPRDEFLRKRAERKRKRRKRRLIATFIISTVMLLAVLAALSLTVFFKIEYIEVTGSAIYSSESLSKTSGVALGDNLWTVSRADIEERLKAKMPYVESVSLERKIPSTLIITVTDAEEFTCYDQSDGYFTVSKSGWVLKKTEEPPQGLVVIKGAEVECEVGSGAVFKKAEQMELVNMLTGLCEENKVPVTLVDVSDNLSLKLMIGDRMAIKLGTVNFAEEKIKHLASMLDEIPENLGGNINLSMWNEGNPQGTFTPGVVQ